MRNVKNDIRMLSQLVAMGIGSLSSPPEGLKSSCKGEEVRGLIGTCTPCVYWCTHVLHCTGLDYASLHVTHRPVVFLKCAIVRLSLLDHR